MPITTASVSIIMWKVQDHRSCSSTGLPYVWRVGGKPIVSGGAGAWELAPTPVDMSTDVDMSTALFITERWSRQPFHPCLAFAIVIFPSLVSSLCAENRLAHVLP